MQGPFFTDTAPVLSMNLESAEMVKHGINAFLSTSIVFTNQIADLCEMRGARISDVVRGMKSDPRIGEKAYLSPGIGFSGGTLGRDLKALDEINRKEQGAGCLFRPDTRANSERKFTILSRLTRILGTLKDRQIGLLGVTYKPGTSNPAKKPPLEIAELMIAKARASRFSIRRPIIAELGKAPPFRVAAGIPDAAGSADILVLPRNGRSSGNSTGPRFREK